jgi:beta-N-acetylhexosaminidase
VPIWAGATWEASTLSGFVEEVWVTESGQVLRDAHAVFLPAIDEATIPGHISDHLAGGGTSVLIGESREEYVAREMSPDRRLAETGEWFAEIASEIRDHAGGKALVAIDQELGGIQRLHDVATALPSPAEAVSADQWSIKAAATHLAEECSALGVNVVLSPIVDVVTGPNPWLEARTVSSDARTVSRIATAFVHGLQSSGRVAATAKHFPGHPLVALDPAVHEASRVEATRSELEPSLDVFRAVIDTGVKVIMTGPTLVPAFDADYAASRSAPIVHFLRTDLGFGGVVLSDDLDAPGILRGSSLDEAAIDALAAGIDWLLVAGTPNLPHLVAAVTKAVTMERLSSARLHAAAQAVRTLTGDIG